MSGASVRYRISSAIQSAIDERGQKAIGSMVGHVASTISRWQSDLSSWSVAALLDLAARDPATAEEIKAAMSDLQTKSGMHSSAEADSCRAIVAASEMSALLAKDLADGRIDQNELRPVVRHAIKTLTDLLSDL